MVLILLLLWIGYCPERYALADLNHRYTPQGKLVFQQLILYDYNHEYRRWDVQHYLMSPEENNIFPTKDGDGWSFAVVRDRKLVRVHVDMFRETHTTHDPEMENARLFDPKWRRGLWER